MRRTIVAKRSLPIPELKRKIIFLLSFLICKIITRRRRNGKIETVLSQYLMEKCHEILTSRESIGTECKNQMSKGGLLNQRGSTSSHFVLISQLSPWHGGCIIRQSFYQGSVYNKITDCMSIQQGRHRSGSVQSDPPSSKPS